MVVDTLRAVLGVWLWLALLRRELLSIPQSVFRMIDRCAGTTVLWWPTAQRETTAMARCMCACYADVGAPAPSVIMATDAMGADGTSNDFGGFGVVAGDVDHELVMECLRLGARPGKALQRDLQLKGRKSPSEPLTRTTPFTRLPPQLFDDRTKWVVLSQGRWLWSEHITRGEMRAVLSLLRILASCARCHRSKILTLQDNMAVAATLSKGRSSTPALNFLLRRRCAFCCFAEITIVAPWVESGKQPADESSRDASGDGA